MRDDIAGEIVRIDKIGHAEFARQLHLAGVDVHADNLCCTGHTSPLNYIEANATQTKDHDARAHFDARRPYYRANSGGDAASDIAHLVKGC